VQFQVAFGSIKHIADLDAQTRFSVGVPSPGLKFQNLAIIISEGGRLSIGCFLGTFGRADAVNTPRRVYGYRVFIFVEAPAGYIKLVRTLIPGISISGIPMPMPVVMPSFFVVRSILGWSEPHIVVETFRWPAIGRNSKRIPGFETGPPGHVHVSYSSFMKKFHRFPDIFDRSVLKSDLHAAVVFPGGFDHLPAFEYIVAGRLFDVNVLSGLTGPYGGEGVPVVGGGDGYRIDVLVIKHVAHIPYGFGFRTDGLFYVGHSFGVQVFIHVTECGQQYVSVVLEGTPFANVAISLTSDPDYSQVDPFISPDYGRVGFSTQSHTSQRYRS